MVPYMNKKDNTRTKASYQEIIEAAKDKQFRRAREWSVDLNLNWRLSHSSPQAVPGEQQEGAGQAEIKL